MRPIDAQNSPREELPRDDVEVVESRLFLSLGNPRQRARGSAFY
jgi:hypothetical protein